MQHEHRIVARKEVWKMLNSENSKKKLIPIVTQTHAPTKVKSAAPPVQQGDKWVIIAHMPVKDETTPVELVAGTYSKENEAKQEYEKYESWLKNRETCPTGYRIFRFQ